MEWIRIKHLCRMYGIVMGCLFVLGCFHDSSSDMERDLRGKLQMAITNVQASILVEYKTCDPQPIKETIVYSDKKFSEGFSKAWTMECEKSFVYSLTSVSSLFTSSQLFTVKFYDGEGNFLTSGNLTPNTLGQTSWELIPYVKNYPRGTQIFCYIFSKDTTGDWYSHLMPLDFTII